MPTTLPSELTMNAVMIPQRSASTQPTQPPAIVPMKMSSLRIDAWATSP